MKDRKKGKREAGKQEYKDFIKNYYREHLNPTLERLYEFIGFDDLEMKAEGMFIYDQDGKKYLDFLAGFGSLNFGHLHPRIVGAVKSQLEKMALSSKVFLNPLQAELAGLLTKITPGNLPYTFFTNSGTEAVECALKLARSYGKSKHTVLYFSNSFHGKTYGALSLTGREVYRKNFGRMLPGSVEVADFNIREILKVITPETIGIIIEPIQGEGGIRVPPPGFLKELREFTRYWGLLLIVDEIQTGFGRTGKNFACEWEEVQPDILTLGKSLGGGVMPIGACLATEEVFSAFFENPFVHSTTFGGNPLACAAGLEAIRLLVEENFAERARQMGEELMQNLKLVHREHRELIRNIRGKGLMVGLEFVQPELAELTILSLRQKGIITAYTLNNPSVIRLEPPLLITSEQIQFFTRALETSLQASADLKEELKPKKPPELGMDYPYVAIHRRLGDYDD